MRMKTFFRLLKLHCEKQKDCAGCAFTFFCGVNPNNMTDEIIEEANEILFSLMKQEIGAVSVEG